MTRRNQLRPGQMFVWDSWCGWCGGERLLVVLDRAHEVDFWTGDRWCVGGTNPVQRVEVVS